MDTTQFNNITTLQGLATYTNSATDGLLFTGGVIVFFIILIMILIRNDQPFENALTVSAWAMFMVSLFLWFAGLLPTITPLAFLFLAAFGTLYLYASR